jgi:hypothetical protein
MASNPILLPSMNGNKLHVAIVGKMLTYSSAQLHENIVITVITCEGSGNDVNSVM